MSEKTAVLETVRKLSEEATFEEIVEAISILAAIKRGEAAADAGKVLPHEEVKKRLAAWTTKEPRDDRATLLPGD